MEIEYFALTKLSKSWHTFGVLVYALNCEQDKWRNINVTAIWGSRQKAKLALKRNLPAPKIDNNHLALSTVVQREEVLDAKPLAISGGTLQSPNSKEQISRFENFQLNISSIYKLEKRNYLHGCGASLV